jgi:signal transduction histidine kinase/ActR/RegA family two-component response regulator
LLGLRAAASEIPADVAIAPKLELLCLTMSADKISIGRIPVLPPVTALEPAPLTTTLRRLADSLSTSSSAEQIYAAALEGIRTALGVDRASVLLFDPDGVMRFRAWSGISEAYRRAVEGHTPWSPGQLAPDPVIVSDVLADPTLSDYQPVFLQERIRALTFIPLLSQRRTVGKFMLYWNEPHAPDQQALDTALTIGAFIGAAVEVHTALAQEAVARERLTRLAEGAQRLMTAADAEDAIREVVTLARDAVRADAYAVWRRIGSVWRIAASEGLDASFVAVELPADPHFPFTEHLVATDVSDVPRLEVRRAAYERAGIRSLVAVPLHIRGLLGGSIVYYYRQAHRPHDIDLSVAQALGHLAAAAISSAELYAEQQALRRLAVKSAERAAFLADVSSRLSSLDYESNLETLAKLAVPRLADWCVVDLVDEHGALRRLAVAHGDPDKVEMAHTLHQRYTPSLDDTQGIYRVIQTGEPVLYEHIDEAILAAHARDAEHLEILRSLGIRSAMLVPLTRGAEVFGAISFVLAGAGRAYDAEDLAFAVELARRASFGIENARLYRQLEDANRSKDEFIAALSHELRTPLNAIIGWASILRASPHVELQRGLDVIHRNAKVQAELVDDLLDASRIVSGKMSIELSEALVVPILRAAVETIMPSAADKAIQIVAELPETHLLVRADSARLQQVFWNILSNAVKFTPAGGTITMTAQVVASEVHVIVRDTGAGIRPEVLPLIFDRFKQADASTTRRFRGLGLGLTLARQLTEMHGGRIAAASEGAGLGATFTVVLPLLERTGPVLDTSAGPLEDSPLRNLHVLVVDDDPDSLEILTSLLGLHSAVVTTATSASEALGLLQREHPDLLISDIAMPDHDGYWLIQQVRQLPEAHWRDIPAVALTAFANAAARERAFASGFAAHLSKPLRATQLVDVVRDIFRDSAR